MRRRWLGIIAALLAMPASAEAETYCVGSPPGCKGVATGFQFALTAAAGSAEDDTIRVGAGTFDGPFTYVPTTLDAGSLHVYGMGSHSTVLRASAPGATVLSLLPLNGKEPRTRVDSLAVHVPEGGTGVNTYGPLGSIHAAAQPGAGGVTGFRVNGSALVQSLSATLPPQGAASTALVAEPAAGDLAGVADVRFLRAEAPRGVRLQNAAVVARSTIVSAGTGIEACSASADVFSSIVVATAQRAIAANDQCAGSPSQLRVRNTTVVGESAAGPALAAADHARIDLDSSIVRGFAHAYSTRGSGVVVARYSLIDLAAADAGSTTPVQDGGHNLNAAPGFLDAAARDFAVGWASPVIDAGNPAGFEGDFPSILGDDRKIDGDGDGTGRRDIGAHEYFGPMPRIAAPATAVTGELVTFDGSASTTVDGWIEHRWTFDDGATTVGPVVKRGFTTAGLHSVTLTVSAPGGHTATRTATVMVSAPGRASADQPHSPFTSTPASTSPTGEPDTTAPVLAGVRVRRGNRLQWTVSEDATLAVTLQRCRRVKGRRCLRWAGPRVTRRVVKAGPGALRLPRAQTGRWRARVVAVDAAGNRSRRATAGFVVRS